jgi:GNAT superfamily N-acetyltransferase
VWISSLYVDPKVQRKGIGQRLLEIIEVFAKSNGCAVVALETHRSAIWALNFYAKNGYQIVNDKMEASPYSAILEKPPVPGRPVLAKLIN